MQLTILLPSILLALPFTLAHPAKSLKPRFVGGQCGIHFTQHQKKENGVGGSYKYDIRLFDSIQETIGGVNGLEVPDLQSRSVDSQLSYTVDITSGLLDADPVTFSYAGQTWNSNSAQCSTGGYDSGSRQGDCGFSC